MIRFVLAATLALGLMGCNKVVTKTTDGGVDAQVPTDAAAPPETGRGGNLTSGAQRMTSDSYTLEATLGQWHIPAQ